MHAAALLRSIHGWLTIIWLVAALPICIFLKDSLPFLVFISVYAVVTGHWSSWQAARVEVHQADDADVREVLEAIEAIEEPRTSTRE